MLRQSGLVPVLVAALAAGAFAAAEDDAFVGTWKLDVAKSKYMPGPGLKGQTVRIDPGGKVTVDTLLPDGKTENTSFTIQPGQEVHIPGDRNETLRETRVGPREVSHVWKVGDRVLHSRGVVSSDGKTMTYTTTGTNSKGQHLHNVEIYEKE